MSLKASKYNVFFNHFGANIGFNGYTKEFIILEPLLFDLYTVGLKKNDFSEMEEVHLDFYNFLIQQSFLVEASLDEFEKVKELSYSIDNDDSTFQLTINPTMNCNFKCWYCYETHIKDSKMDESTITATVNLAANVIGHQKGLKNFILSFFGGEPLLYFNKVIKPILISISTLCESKNINFGCGMTTNGLLINQDMLEICKKYALTNFQITLDGSREQHDKVRFISEGKGSYDRIVQNIILVTKNKLHAAVRINCSVETLSCLNDIMKDFEVLTDEEREYISFDIHKVWQVSENIEKELNTSRYFYKENGYSVTSGSHDTVLDSCYADKRYQATLNYNGEIFKCTARDFKNNSGEGNLNNDGTIAWNEKYEKRLNSKFKNRPCKECKILPICGGGCSQLALENEGVDYCVHNYDEDEKTQQVIDRFTTIMTSASNSILSSIEAENSTQNNVVLA